MRGDPSLGTALLASADPEAAFKGETDTMVSVRSRSW